MVSVCAASGFDIQGFHQCKGEPTWVVQLTWVQDWYLAGNVFGAAIVCCGITNSYDQSGVKLF